jgi:hypothetical protein
MILVLSSLARLLIGIIGFFCNRSLLDNFSNSNWFFLKGIHSLALFRNMTNRKCTIYEKGQGNSKANISCLLRHVSHTIEDRIGSINLILRC